MGGKHYVFLVHGTWAYPRQPDETSAWYETDSPFAQKLRERLTAGDTASTDWELKSFTWEKCGNEHRHRMQAGSDLAQKMEDLRKDDPGARFSFVAHSHGGNVVLEAVSRWIVKRHVDCSAQYGALLKKLEDNRRALGRTYDLYKLPPTPDELRHLLADWEPTAHADELAAIPQGNLLSLGWTEILRTLNLELAQSYARALRSMQHWSDMAADALVTDPAVNGIGRLVFLGTPFLRKRWRYNHHRGWRLVEAVGRVARVTLGLMIYVYVLCVAAAVFFVGWRAWDISRWPWGVFFWGAFIATAVVSRIPEAARARRFVDTNVYFDLASEKLRRFAAAARERGRPLSCLVVSARLLDEAILGMSAEPVVEGAFKPQLRRWLGLDDGPASSGEPGGDRRLQCGVDHDVDRGSTLAVFIRFALKPVTLLARPLWGLCTLAWRKGPGPLIEARIRGIIRRVAEMTATGLPPGGLRYAQVVVGEHIGVDGAFEEQPLCDITETSLRLQSFASASRDEKRFEFLLADRDLPPADERRHFLYAPLTRQWSSPGRPLPAERRRQLQAALVIDERVREATGAIGLVHSSYYGDEQVIEGAARFLRSGVRPPGAPRAPEGSPIA